MTSSARFPAPFRACRSSSSLRRIAMTGLADDFAPANEEQWRQLVVASLKGRGFEQLVSRSDDGFDIQPIYERRMGPRATREGGKWRVIARVDHPEAAPA